MNITDHKLKRYLGYGVYASHDGYQPWLHVNDLGGLNFEHSIALGPQTMRALDDYRTSLVDVSNGIEKGWIDPANLPEQIRCFRFARSGSPSRRSPSPR